MRWDVLDEPTARLALAKKLVPLSAMQGWSRRTLDRASHEALGNREAWRGIFPQGCREAIWFISELSDASMCAEFAQTPTRRMSAVIDKRLAQNAEMKAFVRRVMLFDIRHPIQALRRMQRTAERMTDCLASEQPRPGRARLTALNLLYTLVVFHWLFDTSPNDVRTQRLTKRLMKVIRL